MVITEYHIYFLLSVIIGSFRPIFFKYYGEYFMISIIMELVSIYIGGVFFNLYTTKSIKKAKEQIIESLHINNIFFSILSEIKFVLKQFAVVHLPLSISTPMSNLNLGSKVLFGKLINKETPTIKQIISIFIIIVGCIVLNIYNIFYSKKNVNKTFFYYMGILAIICSSAMSGYIYSVLKKISTETKNPGLAMELETGGVLFILFFVFLYDRIFCKKIKIPPPKKIITMFLILNILFNIDTILHYIGLIEITQLESIYISQFKNIFPILFGFFLYKDHIDIYKIIGLLIIGFGIFLGFS